MVDVDEVERMDPQLLGIFQRFVCDQCFAARLARAHASSALVAEEPDLWVFWANVQAMLSAFANLSKSFWGDSVSVAKARAELRESYGVADDSPLKSRTMRNNYDHFDERVDTWWKTSTNHVFIDRSIGSPDGIRGVDQTDIFRFFNEETGNLTFATQELDVGVILDEVERMFEIAKRIVPGADSAT